MSSNRILSQDEKDMALALGMTEAEYAASTAEQERPTLQKGTYKFQVMGSKVEIVSNPKATGLVGAIQATVQLAPVSTDGTPVKRFGYIFKQITLPVANEGFTPNADTIKYGAQALKWLAEAGKISQVTLLKSIRDDKMVPTDLIGTQLTGRYVENTSAKNGKTYKEVYPETSAKPQLTTLSPDKASATSAVGADASAPF